MTVTAVLVGNTVLQSVEQYDAQVAAHVIPRCDYLEITRSLRGELIGRGFPRNRWQRALAWSERKTRVGWTDALRVASHFARYDKLLTLSEKVAIPISLMQSATSNRIPHTVIAHKLSSGLKTVLMQGRRSPCRFTNVICVSREQARFAIVELGMPTEHVHFIHDKVDHAFFCPGETGESSYVLAVGREQRDYHTLLSALDGTGIPLIVVASSPWSTSRRGLRPNADVTVWSNISYAQLRSVYAQARLVVVPLYNVDYAAGANALLEAMSMAKPVIVTRTPGIDGYISSHETGQYVECRNAADMREQILSLWYDPVRRHTLGDNARQAVVEAMTLDIYVDRVASIVETTDELHNTSVR